MDSWLIAFPCQNLLLKKVVLYSRLVNLVTLMQSASLILRSNNACDILFFSCLYHSTLVLHKYIIHETVHYVAVADSTRRLYVVISDLLRVSPCALNTSRGGRRWNPYPATKRWTYLGWFISITLTNGSSTETKYFRWRVTVSWTACSDISRRVATSVYRCLCDCCVSITFRMRMYTIYTAWKRKLEISIKILIAEVINIERPKEDDLCIVPMSLLGLSR